MSARDRWDIQLKCPICGKTGTADVSQADGWAFERDSSTRVDSVPDGFDYRMEKGRPKFFCLKDNVDV